jgi:hypothetical protein
MKSLLTESLKGFSIAEWPLCRHCNPDGFNVLGLKDTQNGTKDANLRIERTEGDNEWVQNLPVQPTWNDLLGKVEEEMASDNCDKVSGVRGDGVLFGNKYDIITRGSISVIFHVESQEMFEVFITIVQLDGKRMKKLVCFTKWCPRRFKVEFYTSHSSTVSIWNASSQKCCVKFEGNIWKIRFDLLLWWLLISRPKYGEDIFPFIKQN